LASRAGCLSYRALGPPEAVVQAETESVLDRLRGDWQVIAVEQDGRLLPNDQFPFTSLRIRDDFITHEGGPHQHMEVRIRLHPEQQPTAMEMASQGYHGELYDAIYALEGDTLRICRREDGPRPAEFASKPGSSILLYTAKRILPAGP
jgi:uncharacterized protein (TIGR03067 family)